MISFKEFQKIELKVAKIINAERIRGSNKLLKLEIDIGDETRQLIAGIAGFYSINDLIGKEIIVVVNLEPKIIFGFKSEGMLLAADDNGKPVLLEPEREVSPGSKIR